MDWRSVAARKRSANKVWSQFGSTHYLLANAVVVTSSSAADHVKIYLHCNTNDVDVFLSYYFSLDSFQCKKYYQKEHFTHEHALTQKHFVATKNNFTVPSDSSASLCLSVSHKSVCNTYERPDTTTPLPTHSNSH